MPTAATTHAITGASVGAAIGEAIAIGISVIVHLFFWVTLVFVILERTGTETWVMAPMVATVAEARDFADAVRSRGLKAGVMVEVPSAALMADRVLEIADCASIGTNDLTQYTMAADRMATDLAHLTDPWQPAVLQLIAITAEAGRNAGKPVGVCGEAAADPLLAVVLVAVALATVLITMVPGPAAQFRRRLWARPEEAFTAGTTS